MADLVLAIRAQQQYGAVFSNLKSSIGQVQQAAQNASAQMRAMGDSLKNMGGKMTLGVTAPILGFAGAAIKAAADAEQLEVSFTTMLGSAEKAKNMMSELSKFAAATPFETPEIQNASKMLLAFGVAAEDIIPTMTGLGDIAAGLNIPLGDLAYLFGTTRAAGRLMTADLNQFTSRGIPMIAALAKTLGIAESEVKAFVEAGKVGFPEVQAALNSLTAEGGQFSGLMAAQSQTLTGLFSTFKDTIGLTLTEVGKQIIETFDLKGKLASALVWMEKAKNGLLNFAKTNPQLFKLIITIAAIVAGIGPLLVGLGFLMSALAPIAPVIASIGSAFSLLLGPIGLLLAAFGLLFALDFMGMRTFATDVLGRIGRAAPYASSALSELWRKFTDLDKGAYSSVRSIYTFVKTLTGSDDIADRVTSKIIEMGAAFRGALEKIQAVAPHVKSVVGEIWAALSGQQVNVDRLNWAVMGLGKLTGGKITYDAEAKVTTVDWVTAVGNLKYAYDAAAQIFTVDWTSKAVNLTFAYDALAKVMSLDWQTSTELGTFVYDAMAGIFSIDWTGSLDTGGRAAFSYDSATGIKSVDWNEENFTFNYDSTTGITKVHWYEGFFKGVYSSTSSVTSVLWGTYQHFYSSQATITNVAWGAYTHIYDSSSQITEDSVLWNFWTHTYDAAAKIEEKSMYWGAWTKTYDAGAKVLENSIFWGLFTHTYDVAAKASTFTILGKTPDELFKGLSVDLFTTQPQWLTDLTLKLAPGVIDHLVLKAPAADTLPFLNIAMPTWTIDIPVPQWIASMQSMLEGGASAPTSLSDRLRPEETPSWIAKFDTVVRLLSTTPGWILAIGATVTTLSAAPGWVATIGGSITTLFSSPGWVSTIGSTVGTLFGTPGWVTAMGSTVSTLFGTPGWVTAMGSTVNKLFGSPGWVSTIGSTVSTLFGTPGWIASFQGAVNGLLGWIPPWLGGETPAASAAGTSHFRGGLTWVGERGPELVSLPRGSAIYNNRESEQMATAGGPITVIIDIDRPQLMDGIAMKELAYMVADELQRRR